MNAELGALSREKSAVVHRGLPALELACHPIGSAGEPTLSKFSWNSSVVLDTSSTGGSFTGFTVRRKLSVFVRTQSLTDTVTVAEPN